MLDLVYAPPLTPVATMDDRTAPVLCAVGPCQSPRETGSHFCATHAVAAYVTRITSRTSTHLPGGRGGRRRTGAVWSLAVAAILIVISAIAACSGGSNPKSGGNGTNWSSALPSRATALARSGEPANIHIVRSLTKPFEGCRRPNWYGWTTSSGRQLAADELAWFVNHTSPGSCPAYLYLFRDATQTHRSGYNAGAVIYDDKTLELDVGTIIDGPMYRFRTS